MRKWGVAGFIGGMTARHLVSSILVVSFLAACGDGAQEADPPFAFEDLGSPRLVRDGFSFTEGPAWSHAEGVLYFTDLGTGSVHRHAPPENFATVDIAVGQANGLAFDTEGRLLLADQAGRRLVRREADGALTVLGDRVDGARFNSPNDIAVRSDGTIYFTDPDFGFSEPELGVEGIYRLDPDGRLVRESEDDGKPNGIRLSPDESKLYVASTFGGRVDVYDVAADGTLSGRRQFGEALIADGMCLDAQGTLFVASAVGLAAFSPTGVELGVVELPRAPANCGFGGPDGKTLYVTASDALHAINAPVRGVGFPR